MKRLLFAIILLSSALYVPFSSSVSATSPVTTVAVCATRPEENLFGFQPWYACLPKTPEGDIKITTLNDLFLIIIPTVESLVKISALVAAGAIFFMLFKLVLARANPSKVEAAIHGMRDAVIGFVISLAAIAIVNFVAETFRH